MMVTYSPVLKVIFPVENSSLHFMNNHAAINQDSNHGELDKLHIEYAKPFPCGLIYKSFN